MESFMKRVQAVQAELKATKNRVNKFGGYKYRNTEDILQGVKPLLKKHSMVLTLSDEIVAIGGQEPRFYIKATATLRDADSDACIVNTAYAREAADKKGMDESQITGTASSYARKYALNGLLCIDDAIDADNSEAMEAMDELQAVIKCEGCGRNISPFNDGKRGYTPVQIARLSQMRFGKDYCWLCAKDASAKEQLLASGKATADEIRKMDEEHPVKKSK